MALHAIMCIEAISTIISVSLTSTFSRILDANKLILSSQSYYFIRIHLWLRFLLIVTLAVFWLTFLRVISVSRKMRTSTLNTSGCLVTVIFVTPEKSNGLYNPLNSTKHRSLTASSLRWDILWDLEENASFVYTETGEKWLVGNEKLQSYQPDFVLAESVGNTSGPLYLARHMSIMSTSP